MTRSLLAALALSCGLAALAPGVGAQQAPLCAEFLDAETMPKKYRRLAPVLSGGPDDWIITADQMGTAYLPGAEALALLHQIARAFEARGTRLAILMPPPRPLVAGQATLDALSGARGDFDTAAVEDSFDAMVAAVRETGIVMPNLRQVAMASPEMQADFYYRHDTHWTPLGAAASAVALAEAAVAQVPAFAGREPVHPTRPEGGPRHAEKGSLATMAARTCGVEIGPRDHAVPVFPSLDGDLLGAAPARPRVLLAGSSFSDRYGNDAYRVADALAGALGADVENRSVSGGGAIGALEGVVLNGLLDGAEPVDLVVWELPYTGGLHVVSSLRQLLGALHLDAGQPALAGASAAEPALEVDLAQGGVLVLELPGTAAERITLDLAFPDGTAKALKLVRKSHVPADLRSETWAVSLAGYEDRGSARITLREMPADLAAPAAMRHLPAPSPVPSPALPTAAKSTPLN